MSTVGDPFLGIIYFGGCMNSLPSRTSRERRKHSIYLFFSVMLPKLAHPDFKHQVCVQLVSKRECGSKGS